MRKLSNITIGNLLNIFKTMYHKPCGEFYDGDGEYEFDVYPDFYSEENKENMQKLREFAKSLEWDYN